MSYHDTRKVYQHGILAPCDPFSASTTIVYPQLIGCLVLFSGKEKPGSHSLASPDSIRKSISSNSSSSKTNGNLGDSNDLNHTNQNKDQCSSDADLNSSYLNLENIFETGGENNEEGSLEVRKTVEIYFMWIMIMIMITTRIFKQDKG